MKSLTLFIIHSPRIKYREKCIQETKSIIRETCMKKNVKCDIINITSNEINDIKDNTKQIEETINYEKTGIEIYDKSLKPLNLEQLSNFLKQKEAIEKIVQLTNLPEYTDDDYFMVIEDDAYIINDFCKNLFMLLETIEKEEWDVLSLSVSSDNGSVKLLDLRERVDVLPSKEAYMIKKNAANSLLEYLNKIRHTYRFQLSYWIKINKELLVKYFSLRIFLEGSKIGFVPSTTCENNLLIYNKEFMEMFHMVIDKNKYDFNKIRKIYKAVEHLKSPEIMQLYGVILHRENKHSHARDIFTEAVINMVSKNGIINPRSELLNNTINMYGLYQDDLSMLTSKPSKYKKVNFT